MKSAFVVVILCAFFCMSCKKNNTNGPQPSSFQGVWKGTYTGSTDNGSFQVNVAADGKVTGTATSIVLSQTWNADGAVVSSGQITATFGTATSGATFSGILSGNTGSGTWVNTSAHNGTWTGTKQ